MDFTKIKKGSFLVSLGITFIMVSLLSSLSSFKGFEWASYLGFLSIPGYIIELVGLFKMGKQEKRFMVSFIASILNLVLAIVIIVLAIVLSKNENIGKINYIIGKCINVIDIVSICMIFEGLCKVFAAKGMERQVKTSKIFQWIYLIIVIISVALDIFGNNITGSGQKVLLIVSLVCMILPQLLIICHCEIAHKKL